jgi:hypothetical protein
MGCGWIFLKLWKKTWLRNNTCITFLKLTVISAIFRQDGYGDYATHTAHAAVLSTQVNGLGDFSSGWASVRRPVW